MSDINQFFASRDPNSKANKILEAWKPFLESDKFVPINDPYKKYTTAVILENSIREQAVKINEARRSRGMDLLPLTENVAGVIGPAGLSGTGLGTQTGGLAGFDPIMIPMIRRAAPNLMAYDICGVQPLSAPTGLVFAFKAHYNNRTGPEALFNEPDPAFSGGTNAYTPNASANTGSSTHPLGGYTKTTAGSNPGLLNTDANAYERTDANSNRIAREVAETLSLDSSAANQFRQMQFSIERTSVEAKTRSLAVPYTIELQQDLMAIHGLDAERELMNMLSSEMLAEINRDLIRTVYWIAKPGAQGNGITTAGTWDIADDSNGRWQIEHFKGLHLQIQFDCNAIAKETRRGKGNFLIVSDDVAACLASAKLLDYSSGLTNPGVPGYPNVSDIDATGNLYAGTLDGRIKVYVDPFGANYSEKQYYVAGYKGSHPYDAGLFYCPYVPLEFLRAQDPDTFQPRIAFKTRYGLIANPYVVKGNGTPDADDLTASRNHYYRRVLINSLR